MRDASARTHGLAFCEKREPRFFNEYAASQSRRFSHNLNENESGIHKGFFLTEAALGLVVIMLQADGLHAHLISGILWIVMNLENILYLVNKAIMVLALLLGS